MSQTSIISQVLIEEVYLAKDIETIQPLKILWRELQSRVDSKKISSDIDYFCSQFGSLDNTDSKTSNSSRLHAEGHPYFLILQEQGKPVAGLIGRQYQHKQFIKFGYFSFQAPSLECLELEIDGCLAINSDAALKIVNYLIGVLDDGKADLISIKHLPQDNNFLNQLLKHRQLPTSPVISPFNEWLSPILDLESGNRISLGKSRRAEKRARAAARKLHHFFEDEIEVICLSEPSQVPLFLAEAELISQTSYQQAVQAGISNTPFWRNELGRLATRGAFRGYILYGAGKPVGYNVGAAYNGLFMGYAMCFNPEFSHLSPGVFLLRQVSDALANEGIHTLHFGYGDSEYKKRFGQILVPGIKLRLYSNNLRARCILWMDQGSTQLNQALKELLQQLGYLDKIKKLWRSRLAN